MKEHTIISVEIFAKINRNDDGTWTAIACLGPMEIGPVTRGTREAALADAQKLASVKPMAEVRDIRRAGQ